MHLKKRYEKEQEQQDRRFGRICAIIANVNRKPETQAYSEEDFIPKPAPPPQTPEQQISILETIAAFAQAKYGGDATNEQTGTQESEQVEQDEPK